MKNIFIRLGIFLYSSNNIIGGNVMDTNETNGFQNEQEFAKALNGKKIKYLMPNLQDMILKLYGYVDFNSYIFCYVDHSKKNMKTVSK